MPISSIYCVGFLQFSKVVYFLSPWGDTKYN